MQNRTNEHWLCPCDLCGSLNYEQLGQGAAPLHRCRECGLVQRAEDQQNRPELRELDATLFGTVLHHVVRRTGTAPSPSILIIGRPPESIFPYLQTCALHTTLLVDHSETSGLEGITYKTGRVEQGLFRAEQFDVILCAHGIESMESAANLFAKARLWLAPQGLLFVGGTNWGSLIRRILSRRWQNYHREGRIFADYRHIKEYALRYGFDTISSGTQSRIDETAAIAFAVPAPSIILRAATLPFWLAANLPRLGETYWSILSKRNYTVRPIKRRLEEEQERAPGLAAATFGRASRERIEAVSREK